MQQQQQKYRSTCKHMELVAGTIINEKVAYLPDQVWILFLENEEYSQQEQPRPFSQTWAVHSGVQLLQGGVGS